MGTVARKTYGAHVIRQNYPNDASLYEIDSGSDLAVRVNLTFPIYNDDKNGGAGTSGTDPTITIPAGWADDGSSNSTNAVTALTMTNNSTLDYPSCIGTHWDWASIEGGWRPMVDDFSVGFHANHIFGIDSVLISAIGATSAVSTSSHVTSKTSHQYSGTGLYSESYKLPVTLSSYTQGERIDLRAICYPVVGDADSIIDTNNKTAVNERIQGRTTCYVYCDKDYAVDSNGRVSAGMRASLVGFVDIANGTASGTIGTASAAEANMFSGQGEAINAGARIVYVKNSGTPLFVKGWGNNTVTDYYPIITEDPADPGAVLSRDTNGDDNFRQAFWCYEDIAIAHTANQGWLDGENGSRQVLFNRVEFQNSYDDGVGIGYRCSGVWFVNCTGMGTDSYGTSGTARIAYIFAGCQAAASDSFGTDAAYYMVGCYAPTGALSFFKKSSSNPAPTQDKALISHNIEYYHVINGGTSGFIYSDDFSGWQVTGNITIAGTVSASGPMYWLGGDTSSVDVNNSIIAFNTCAGERWNVFYNDAGTAAVLRNNIACFGNAVEDFNIKSDTFLHPTDGRNGNRTGNHPQMFGTLMGYNAYDGSVSASFLPDEYGPGDELVGTVGNLNEFVYVNNQSATAGGSGGGDYTPDTGSPLILSTAIPEKYRYISFDSAGTANNGLTKGAVFIAASGGDQSVSFSSGGESDSAFGARVIAPVSISAGAQASESLTAVAQITASIVEGAESGDLPNDLAQAVEQILGDSESSDLVAAIAQAGAAIAAGANSNESWVATVQAIVSLNAGALSADDLEKIVEGLAQEAINEGAQSAVQFLAAINTIQFITGAANSGEALAGTVTAICILSDQAISAAAFTGTDRGILGITKTLLAAAQSSGLFSASLSVTASISAGVLSSASFVAVGQGATGYLVASAVTLVAHLSGTLTLTPELSGTLSLEPNS